MRSVSSAMFCGQSRASSMSVVRAASRHAGVLHRGGGCVPAAALASGMVKRSSKSWRTRPSRRLYAGCVDTMVASTCRRPMSTRSSSTGWRASTMGSARMRSTTDEKRCSTSAAFRPLSATQAASTTLSRARKYCVTWRAGARLIRRMKEARALATGARKGLRVSPSPGPAAAHGASARAQRPRATSLRTATTSQRQRHSSTSPAMMRWGASLSKAHNAGRRRASSTCAPATAKATNMRMAQLTISVSLSLRGSARTPSSDASLPVASPSCARIDGLAVSDAMCLTNLSIASPRPQRKHSSCAARDAGSWLRSRTQVAACAAPGAAPRGP
mmetsp:Transcript_22019/g.64937  ORF Transcript_22019/g.64937 Transcript_22019/m.64937 type:complete len:330 (+) Transcript_22019:5731-6720(+)